ncbi:nitroreductase, partial [Micromonospora zhanjiangensis]
MTASPNDHSLTSALGHAAATAGYAPSVHNTQPWRWRVLPERLELYAVRDRQLGVSDPDGRLMILSCGTALHHARIALRAEGWTTRVDRLPDPATPDLLARITGTGHAAPSPAAMRVVQSVRVRHTDRRPVAEEEVPEESVAEIVRAAGDEGAQLQILSRDQVVELAAAASKAAAASVDEPQLREELRYWTERAGPAGTGLPPEVLPERAPESTVPARD